MGQPGAIAIGLQTKRGNLLEVLDLVRQILREPTLPDDQFELIRQERLAGAEKSRTDPMALGSVQLSRLLADYPEDDVRYVPTIDEQIARLKATKVAEVRRLHDEFLGAEHGELAVVGDFDPETLLPAVNKVLEGWKADRPYTRIERPYQTNIETARRMISTPDKANAMLAAGMNLPLGDTAPDYACAP